MRFHVNRLIPTMLETQTPIVTAATGYVIGLGLNLVLASDFAVVADDARLRAPFTGMGFTPDSGASWLIPRLVGVARAKEMLLLGREITGLEAAEWGLVHRAAPERSVPAVAARAGRRARAARRPSRSGSRSCSCSAASPWTSSATSPTRRSRSSSSSRSADFQEFAAGAQGPP